MKTLLLHTIDLDIKPFIQNLPSQGTLQQAHQIIFSLLILLARIFQLYILKKLMIKHLN